MAAIAGNSDSPEPAQDVDREHGDAGPGGHAGKRLLRARLAMRELVAADHNGDQAGDSGNRAGEEVLERGKSCIEGGAALRERGDREQQRQRDYQDRRPPEAGTLLRRSIRRFSAWLLRGAFGNPLRDHWHLRRLKCCRHVPKGSAALPIRPRLLVYGTIARVYGRLCWRWITVGKAASRQMSANFDWRQDDCSSFRLKL